MKKHKDKKISEAVDRIRQTARAELVSALRDGRVQRAHRFTDKRKEAARRACRGRFST